MKVFTVAMSPPGMRISSFCHWDSGAVGQPIHFKSLLSTVALLQPFSPEWRRCLECTIPRPGCCLADSHSLLSPSWFCSSHTMCDSRPWVRCDLRDIFFSKLSLTSCLWCRESYPCDDRNSVWSSNNQRVVLRIFALGVFMSWPWVQSVFVLFF